MNWTLKGKSMNKGKLILVTGIFFAFLFLPILVDFKSQNNAETTEEVSDKSQKKLKTNGLIHSPIRIENDSDFIASNGVIKGDGSKSNPYVIANWTIDAGGTDSCIMISNTTKYFSIKNCTLFNSGTSWNDAGILLNQSERAIIYNNTSFNNNNGIRLLDSNHTKIIENNCSSNFQSGVRLDISYNNTISGNKCSFNNEDGISLYYSNNNTLLNNSCFSNFKAIDLQNSMNNTINENYCHLNAYGGIEISYSNQNNVSYNTCFSNQFYGIGLGESTNNTIYMNNCSLGNHSGIYLIYSENNTVKANNCSENARYGIYMISSNNNTIWVNIFQKNSYSEAYCEDSEENNWEYNRSGNYWGDYQSRYPDATNDGYVWDTPYKINETDGDYDHYPLVNQGVQNIDNTDNTAPSWDEIPTDQTISFNKSFRYDVNASDASGIDHYWINDTDNFIIDSNGVITNKTNLSVGSYWLEIRAYDPYENYNSTVIKITVESVENEDSGDDSPDDPPDEPSGEDLEKIPGFKIHLMLGCILISIITLFVKKYKKLSVN